MSKSGLSLVPTAPGDEESTADEGGERTPGQSLRGVNFAETFSGVDDVNAAIAARLSLLKVESLTTDPRFSGPNGLCEATRVRDELLALRDIRRGFRAQVNVAYA